MIAAEVGPVAPTLVETKLVMLPVSPSVPLANDPAIVNDVCDGAPEGSRRSRLNTALARRLARKHHSRSRYVRKAAQELEAAGELRSENDVGKSISLRTSILIDFVPPVRPCLMTALNSSLLDTIKPFCR